MDEEVFPLGRVKLEFNRGEGVLAELNYSLIAEFQAIRMRNSCHLCFIMRENSKWVK